MKLNFRAFAHYINISKGEELDQYMADKEMYFDTSSANNLGTLTLEPDESMATPS